jgi:ligand-binding sensor domain-containing protein
MGARRLILILFFCLGTRAPAFAQSEYTPFTHFSDPVLKQNSVYDIVQDRTGFLWVGTYNGLLRYDGYTFKSYHANPLDSNSIFTGPVNDICIDKSGNLWLNVLGAGIAYMDLKSDKITRYRYNPAVKNSLASPLINDMKLDNEGNLWMTSYDKIIKRDNRKGIFINYAKGTHGLPDGFSSGVHCSPDGRIWVGIQHQGLYVYDKTSDKFLPYTIRSTREKFVSVVLQDNPGNLWIGSFYGLQLIDKEGRNSTIIKSSPVTPGRELFGATSILRDRQGKVWVGTLSQGLYVYDAESGRQVRFLHDPGNANSIRSNLIHIVFEDENGNLWIGGSEGLSKISPFQREVNLYSTVKKGNRDDRIKDVRAIHKDSSGLWLGTAGEGLWHISPSGKIARFNFDPPIKQYGYNYINCILNDGQGNLLLGTNHGVEVFSLKRQKCIRSYIQWEVFPSRKLVPIWSLQLLNGDSLLAGSKDSGLICLNLKTGAYKRYLMPVASVNTAEPFSVWYIHQDKNRKIWLGTSLGLALFNPAKSGEELVALKPRGTAFPGNNIFHIHEDNTGMLWLAFVDGGLVKYDKKTGHAKLYDMHDGLPSNIAGAILEDGQRNVWISTTSGLCVFDPDEGKVIHRYTESDGLQANHFFFKSCAIYRGEMFFGGVNGVTSFYPEKLFIPARKAKVFMTSFELLYNDTDAVNFGSTLSVPYDQNTFSFEFASSDLTNPEKNEFAYKLVGEMSDWVVQKNQHNLAFNSLSPGTYTLLVKGTNANGEWGPPSSLRIVIHPPFWRTWWFYLLLALAALSILLLVIIQIYKRKDAQRKQVISELAALRTQLNPHFIFNSLGSLQHFIVFNQQTLALEYLTKFARMMRMILEYSSQDTITLSEEINFLSVYLYMEATRTDHTIVFDIDADEIANPKNVKIPPMLLQPLIENAIIHGLVAKQTNGKIKLRFSVDKNYLVCEVEDNGVGREAATLHRPVNKEKPMAMNIIKERLAMLEGQSGTKGSLEIIDLKTDAGVATGTRVVLYVPYMTVKTKNICLE